MKIGFIGTGKLGMPCAEAMASKQHNVTGYDIAKCTSHQVTMMPTIEDAVKGRDIVFVAVPTPHDPDYDGREPTAHLAPKDFNYDIVKDVLVEANKHMTQDQLLVLISTVLPGTTRKQFVDLVPNTRFVYNPYLIAMGSVAWDMVNPEMVMIGTEDGSATGDAKQLVAFYKTIMENNPRYEIGTWDECECIKVFYNTFISTKIGLANMIQDVAQKQGNINVDVVTDALAKSTMRIMGPQYMKAGMGDGGGCVLPTFPIEVNGNKISIEEFHKFFNSKTVNLVKSANYAMSKSDEKKVYEATTREYDGTILVFHTKSGKTLKCTAEHLLPVSRDGARLLIRADEVLDTDKLFSV